MRDVRFTRLIPGLLAVGTLGALAPAQATDKVAGLGGVLFSSTALSKGRTTSCATCHDPNKSFIDGRAEARGEMQIDTGRNTPTLFGMTAIPKFRDPRQAQDAKPGRTPRVLNLEDRCLEPLESELEMGSGTDEIVVALKKEPEMAKRFDEAFGEPGGVTKTRLGKALAAFVRAIDGPQSAYRSAPYAKHLAGEAGALNAQELRGLEVFKKRGCAECHSGPALSDGLMHVVDPPDGQRMRDRQRTASARHIELLRREYAAKKTVQEVLAMSQEALAKEARLRAHSLPGGGGYDADQIEVQTTTLWDVRRTAPYFRDGSLKTLEDAVRTHIREMRMVVEDEAKLKKDLAALDRVGKRSPVALRANSKNAAIAAAGRADLPPEELQDLLAFLDSLSPRPTPK
jgi:cytochrome c peroxidase